LGIGLAALLSGANTYYGLDALPHAEQARNATVLEQLVRLFKERAPIPGDHELPDVKPYLDSYRFPHHILTEERMAGALRHERLRQIRRALGAPDGEDGPIRVMYKAPWDGTGCIEEQSVDMIVSQAVLEHVSDLERTYVALRSWLRPSGWMSHQIDFRSHGTSRAWNGHWAYSDRVWRLISGVWPYFLNRQPYSVHAAIMRRLGLQIMCDIRVRQESGIGRERLASRFRELTADDITTSGAFVVASKVA
jgi:hypothetical protein